MTESIPSNPTDAQEKREQPYSVRQHVRIEIRNVSGNGTVFTSPKKKQVITVLLLGETGSGKTAFLSLILNLLQGNGPFELEEKHFRGAESGLNKTQSQTTEAVLYNFTATDGFQFQIIDTPGLADTRGMDNNKIHREKICRAIKELVASLDGIMLVANGRLERLSITTSYTLETLATLLPRSVKDNIGIIFTNVCTDERGLNFQMQSLPPDIQAARYWCLDNPLSLYKGRFPSLRQATESNRQLFIQANNLRVDYDNTVKSLDGWLAWLDERDTIPTNTIVELFHKSTEIETRLYGTTLSLENLAQRRKHFQNIIQDLEAVEKEQKSLAEVLNREPPEVWELKATSDANTICLSSGCHSNCHLQCSLELNDPRDLGGWCRVFKTFHVPNWLIPFKDNSAVMCSVCDHEASEHRNYKGLHEEQPSSIYLKAVQGLEDTDASKESLKKTRDEIDQEIVLIAHNIEESKQGLIRLVDEMNNLSLSPSYAGYIRSAIELFELRKKQLESSADSDGELLVIDKGIMTLKSHLQLLRDSGAGRVITRSHRIVERGLEDEEDIIPGAMVVN